MPLMLYNTLTRHKERFEPIEPGKVRMYVCGITAYNYFHVGNARVFVIFDVVRRYLQWLGYKVRYVQNFTDIDDKILKRAIAENSTMEQIAEKYIAAYFEDADRLNILRADEYPRATHTIDGIQRLIHELEQRQYAYAADGDVYYAVRQFPEYGKLSGRKLDEMQAGASGRVDVEEDAGKKKDPADFALWKAAKPGEPSWESPWGAGRPGWHIECSAMVRDELGESIDIHAGGMDLTFPHHENEIAQSEAVTGKPLAKYWLHNGFINMDGEKMSKSLGNFRLTRDLLANYDPMAFRLFVLQAQYRKPIDFTSDALDAAANSWGNLRAGLQCGYVFREKLGQYKFSRVPYDEEKRSQFQEAMDDDINTPRAIALLFEWVKFIRKESQLIQQREKPESDLKTLASTWKTLVEISSVLGLTDLVQTPLVGSELLTKVREFAHLPIYALAQQCGYYTKRKKAIRSATKADIGKFYRAVRDAENEVSASLEPVSLEPLKGRRLREKFEKLSHLGDKEKAERCGYRKEIEAFYEELLHVEKEIILSLQDFMPQAQVLNDDKIKTLVKQRQELKKMRRFEEADHIRKELHSKDIELSDQKDGTTSVSIKLSDGSVRTINV